MNYELLTMSDSLIFETNRLQVRRYTTEDFENFFRLNGDAEVVRYIRPVQSREEAMLAFENQLADYEAMPGYGRWAVHLKTTGEFVGSFAMIPIPDEPEKMQLGYAFPTANWGKGYATELTIAGLDHFRNKTDLPAIYAVTETPNVASQNVLLKAGFHTFGKKMEGDKELLVFIVKR
jgi:ribosomal-protein-alanine N-acetyltransferase